MGKMALILAKFEELQQRRLDRAHKRMISAYIPIQQRVYYVDMDKLS